ncbi:ATP synthase membrane subunit K, mitochondrial-like isoform X1 [Phyllopteryx taeniolatus]|uniref:ATP synthase membrane subunit K, mitochondrial-like isoform X1 n=1 Tax=Phyllopteryx taeniolatus TaxID=161469 RepID=UPI002AD1D770|nr:ATP synthase membrane subunit K, mitochondrial-like isoform X1 [Phyllopteryx taeniolatus]
MASTLPPYLWQLAFTGEFSVYDGTDGRGFKRQLFAIEAPASVELTGLRKYFNSYTLQGRRNCVLATYGIMLVTATAYFMHRQNKKEAPKDCTA